LNLIVDVRSREEYYKRHVKGSLNISLFDLEFCIDFLRDKDVLFYCDTGRRSRMAVEYLGERGIKASLILQQKNLINMKKKRSR